MVSQLDPAIKFNSGNNCGLDPMVGSSCGTIQLWHYRFVLNNRIIKLEHEHDPLNKQIKQHDTFNTIARLQ